MRKVIPSCHPSFLLDMKLGWKNVDWNFLEPKVLHFLVFLNNSSKSKSILMLMRFQRLAELQAPQISSTSAAPEWRQKCKMDIITSPNLALGYSHGCTSPKYSEEIGFL